jgi:two-component system, NtrC family, response regulator
MESEGAALAGLLGCSPAIERLRRDIRLYGPSDVRVHVFGETGAGKELVAKALHAASPRARRPLVAVNAAGFTDDLLVAELFGHTRGAFTGAVAAREGYAAEAHGSTLFIDEVGDMSSLAQVRLLRFLEGGEYQRLGETVVRRADVRVISATNVDVAQRVQEGRFRQDLWFRLNGETITVPPLRERGADVLLLARHFLRAHAAGREGALPALSREVEAALLGHSWPGNVRELQNEMRRLAVRAAGREATVEDLSSTLRGRAARKVGTLHAVLRNRETELVRDALERNGGVMARAAADLGISRQSLWTKARQLGLVGTAPGRCYSRRPSTKGARWDSGTQKDAGDGKWAGAR